MSTESFDPDRARGAILEAALPHVPFDGWTLATLRQGARDAGYPPETALRVFQRGAIEAIELWCARADRAMLAAIDGEGWAGLRTRERIAALVRARLAPLAAHREAVRRALALLALPHNAPIGAAVLWRTIGLMWYAAGDRATDFNYYTKRALLAGVYSATLFHWLDDRSPDAQDSWAFLDRRIAEALALPRAVAGLGERVRRLMPRRFLDKGA